MLLYLLKHQQNGDYLRIQLGGYNKPKQSRISKESLFGFGVEWQIMKNGIRASWRPSSSGSSRPVSRRSRTPANLRSGCKVFGTSDHLWLRSNASSPWASVTWPWFDCATSPHPAGHGFRENTFFSYPSGSWPVSHIVNDSLSFE